MTVENEVANLTTSVDSLTEAVNVKKQTLDNSVTAAETARDTTTGLRDEAAASETAAATSATEAATSATEAATARDDAVAVVYSGDATLEPAPGSIPVANSDSQITPKWIGSGEYPTIRPSLNLDFANTKSLDPRIDFTRATTATYYDGQTFAKAEENLFKYSQQFNQWDTVNLDVFEDVTSAPDGTATADRLQATATNNTHYAYNDRSALRVFVEEGKDYALSVYLKKDTNDFAQIWGAGSQFGNLNKINIDLVAGTITSVSTWSASLSDVGDGWYRVEATITANVTSNSYITFGPIPTATHGRNTAYSADGTESIFIWGAQIEERSQVTAYTPTTDHPITNYIPVLKTAAPNEPRFDHDPVTGESKGLLIEEQRTNLIPYSEDFNQWVTSGMSLTENTTIAPDGTLSAYKMSQDASTGRHGIRLDSISPRDGQVYTRSFFAKAAEARYIHIGEAGGPTANSNTRIFDLINGEWVFKSTDGVKHYSEFVGNGWYRISFEHASSDAFNDDISINIANGTGQSDAESFTGDGFSGIYIWGAQLEEGSFPTSYIKTEGSQVTRVADSASITGENFSEWYRQDEGTVFGEFKAISEIDDGSFDRVFDINDGTGNNSFRIFRASDDFDFNSKVNGQSKFFAESSSDFAVDNFGSFAFAVSSDSISTYADGNELKTETESNNLSTTVDRLSIGADHTLSLQLNGTIKRLTYYPKRLPNAVLQTLTEE